MRIIMNHLNKAKTEKDMTANNPQGRKKALTLALVALVLAVFAAVTIWIGKPLLQQFRESPETFRAYVNEHWFTGSLIMTGIIILQVVVAFIPGEPFELGAGFVFGWIPGSVICLVGSTLASALVFLMVRKWGMKLVELFFPREKIMSYSFLNNSRKLNMLTFVLFLVPGTPKDLLTYLAGLTPMKMRTFLLLTMVARIPSVITSTISGSLTQEGNYRTALITYGITLAVTVICSCGYRMISKRKTVQAE